jgi:hypothetical protein
MCRRSRCSRVNEYELVDGVELCDGLLVSGERAWIEHFRLTERGDQMRSVPVLSEQMTETEPRASTE